jgi:hypothetical protein
MGYNRFIELIIYRKETGLPMPFQERLIKFVLASIAVFSCALADDSKDLKSIRSDLASTSIKVVDQKIEELTDVQAGKVVPELVAIVDSGRHPIARTAINRLAKTDEQLRVRRCWGSCDQPYWTN